VRGRSPAGLVHVAQRGYAHRVEDKDVRWRQRYANFARSITNLEEALTVASPSKLERQGIIKAFELCYELAWKTLQDYLREQGVTDAVGPKAVIRRAFQDGLITDGDGWGAMHQARNESAHLYDEARAAEIETSIRDTFASLLYDLGARLKALDR